jgi:hypothetical protein
LKSVPYSLEKASYRSAGLPTFLFGFGEFFHHPGVGVRKSVLSGCVDARQVSSFQGFDLSHPFRDRRLEGRVLRLG